MQYPYTVSRARGCPTSAPHGAPVLPHISPTYAPHGAAESGRLEPIPADLPTVKTASMGPIQRFSTRVDPGLLLNCNFEHL